MTRSFILCLIALACAFGLRPVLAAETFTYEAVLSRVLATYPSLEVAALQLQRARQENARVESQLGWNLGAQAGVARDTSFFGATSDRADAGASLQRRLKSGASVGVEGAYAYEDSAITFSPLFPNPLSTTRFDLRYRQPLRQGAGNPDYYQGLANAQAGVEIAEANRGALHDQIARETADLYYSAYSTQARIRSVEKAIARAERLRKYVKDNLDLGLSEEADTLQAEAQLRTQLAEREALRAPWEQQRTLLNRLMGRPWDAEFEPAPVDALPEAPADLGQVLPEAQAYNPTLRRSQAQLKVADAAIARARDAAKDRVDVIYSIGNRTRSGEAFGTDVDESDVVGGIQLEYNRALDGRGADAILVQAQLDRDIALQEIALARDDVRYNVAALLAEIQAAERAVERARERFAAERRKLREAEERYRAGRTDTARLIDFERELSLAELALEQQVIDLSRRHTELALLRGSLWQTVSPRDTP